MADDGFVLAYKPPHGEKRRVPKHYLTNPALGFKAAPSGAVREPAATDTGTATNQVTEPATRGNKKEVTG